MILNACSKGVGGKSQLEYEEIISALIESVKTPLEELTHTLVGIESDIINEPISVEELINIQRK